MGIVFRQSAKNLSVVVAGAMMGAVVIWISTKFNTQQQYGSIGILTNYSVLLSQILPFGVNNTMAVYIHKYGDDDQKRKLLITLTLAIPLLFLILFGIVFLLQQSWILSHFQQADIPFMRKYLIWLPAFTLFLMYTTVLEQYLGSQLKVALPAFMREVVFRLLNISLILLFGFGIIDFHVLVVGTVMIFSVPPLIFLVLAVRTKAFGLSLRFKDFSKAEYRDMAHFSWYHFLITVSVILMASMDITVLPWYDHRGSVSVAIYRVAIFFLSFLQMPLKAMLPASFTVLAKAFADGDIEKARDIFVRASLNILIPSVGIAILLCCNMPNAIAVIKSGYSEVAPVFMILFVGTLVNIASGMTEQVLSITNYYKFNFYLSLVIMVILFFLLRSLVPVYGIYGAAASTAICLFSFSLIKCYFVWLKLKIQPYSRKTLLILISAVPAALAGYFLPDFFGKEHHVYVHAFADTCIRSIVIIAIYAGMLLWLKPSADLEEYLRTVKKNKRLF